MLFWHHLAFNLLCHISTTWYLICCHNFFYCLHLALIGLIDLSNSVDTGEVLGVETHPLSIKFLWNFWESFSTVSSNFLFFFSQHFFNVSVKFWTNLLFPPEFYKIYVTFISDQDFHNYFKVLFKSLRTSPQTQHYFSKITPKFSYGFQNYSIIIPSLFYIDATIFLPNFAEVSSYFP